eukprot:scaffold104897_cov72-Phaeocystis_antarctica.AAC.2
MRGNATACDTRVCSRPARSESERAAGRAARRTGRPRRAPRSSARRKSCLLSVVSLVNSPVSPRKPGEAAEADGERETASGGNGGLPPPASPAPASLPSSSSASAFNSGCRSISPAVSPSAPLLSASCSNRCLRLKAANGGVFGPGIGSGLEPGRTAAALQAAASASAALPRFSSAESSLGARGQAKEARAASGGTPCHGDAFDPLLRACSSSRRSRPQRRRSSRCIVLDHAGHVEREGGGVLDQRHRGNVQNECQAQIHCKDADAHSSKGLGSSRGKAGCLKGGPDRQQRRGAYGCDEVKRGNGGELEASGGEQYIDEAQLDGLARDRTELQEHTRH